MKTKVIKSGNWLAGICGKPVGHSDSFENELFIGDIVQTWYQGADGNKSSDDGFTVMVNDDHTTYSDGNHKYNGDTPSFPMGIKDAYILQHKEIIEHDGESELTGWIVRKLKDHSDALVGEKWNSFGFNYDEVELEGQS